MCCYHRRHIAGEYVFDTATTRMIYQQLLKKFPIISHQVDEPELAVILHELEKILQMDRRGSVVEFGCYTGTTSLFIRRLLDAYQVTSEYHVYDSFEGLPEKSGPDRSVMGEQFVAGELRATKKELLMNFKKAHLTPPIIHKGWFSQVAAHEVPDSIQFAFLDGDYFESIRDSLVLVTPRLAPGAIIVVDDYANEALPGAALAVDEWRRTHPCRLRVQASLGVITT